MAKSPAPPALAQARGARIRAVRELRRLTQAQIAAKLGVSAQSVSQWETGETTPALENLNDLSSLLGARLQWLVDGSGPRDRGDANVAPSGEGGISVPLIDAVTAGRWGAIANPYEPGAGAEFVQTSQAVGGGAFALRIRGTSMEPRFREGDIIVVDPAITPQPGDFVVAKLDHEEEATFKKYRPRGFDQKGQPIIELVPLNEDWPILRVDADSPGHIVGVMVEHRSFRHR
ncbi:MAG TPA: S24 family peptidase [Alphaproteobacteria bacterium]|nr:S24 family peptidase [Alphaproteobacteria bacterium]